MASAEQSRADATRRGPLGRLRAGRRSAGGNDAQEAPAGRAPEIGHVVVAAAGGRHEDVHRVTVLSHAGRDGDEPQGAGHGRADVAVRGGPRAPRPRAQRPWRPFALAPTGTAPRRGVRRCS